MCSIADRNKSGSCSPLFGTFFPWYRMNKMLLDLYYESQVNSLFIALILMKYPLQQYVTGLSNMKSKLHLFEIFITVKNSMHFIMSFS